MFDKRNPEAIREYSQIHMRAIGVIAATAVAVVAFTTLRDLTAEEITLRTILTFALLAVVTVHIGAWIYIPRRNIIVAGQWLGHPRENQNPLLEWGLGFGIAISLALQVVFISQPLGFFSVYVVYSLMYAEGTRHYHHYVKAALERNRQDPALQDMQPELRDVYIQGFDIVSKYHFGHPHLLRVWVMAGVGLVSLGLALSEAVWNVASGTNLAIAILIVGRIADLSLFASWYMVRDRDLGPVDAIRSDLES